MSVPTSGLIPPISGYLPDWLILDIWSMTKLKGSFPKFDRATLHFLKIDT